MPLFIRDPELEAQLTDQLPHCPVGTQKTPLARSIIRTVLDAAHDEGVDVFTIMRRLREERKGNGRRSAS